MHSAARSTFWASLFCMALPMTALGQSQSSPLSVGDSPPTALPDTVYRAVGARPVALLLTDNTAVNVCIKAVRPERLIISLLDGGQLMTLPRASVKNVRLLDSAPSTCPPAPPDPPDLAPRPRHLGVSGSFLPGLALDWDVKRFHGFANLGVLFAAATQGGIIPVSIGLGVGLPLWPDTPGLRLDLFAHVNFVGDTHANSDFGFHLGNWLAFGVGVGLHKTWNNGVTLGFALPLFGYSFLLDSPLSHVRDLATGFGYYFATSGETLPAFYVGYRQ